MAYDPSQNYQLVQTGVWADRRGSLKNPGNLSVEQCQVMCDSDTSCDGFAYWPNQRRCETYSGTNFSSVHGTDQNALLYRKSQQVPLGTGIYQGNPLQVGGCCSGGSQDPNVFAVLNGARQPMTPNTQGSGSCGGFNGYGDWNGWGNGFGNYYACCNGCPESFDISMCPVNLATPTGGEYVPPPQGGRFDGVYSQCTYNTLNWPSLINGQVFNDTIGKQLLTDASWAQAKDDYCLQLANVDSQPCQNWLDTYGQSSCSADPNNCSSASYNSAKLQLCKNAPNWTTIQSCVQTVNNVMKTGLPAEQTTAEDMVSTYCNANPTDPLCGCFNVTSLGSQCISDASKHDLPGCSALNSDFGNLPNYASVIAADKFCASSDCITNALSSGTEFIPAARSPQQTCPTIQACIQDFRNANFSGANLTAECKQTLNINTPPAGAPSPTAVGAQPPSPAGTPVTTGTDGSKLPITNPTIANVLNTSTKQYGAIGGCVLFILCCCAIILLLIMGGESKSSGPDFTSLLAARAVGIGG